MSTNPEGGASALTEQIAVARAHARSHAFSDTDAVLAVCDAAERAEKRDALSAALEKAQAVIKEAAKSANVNNLNRAANILANYQLDDDTPTAALAAYRKRVLEEAAERLNKMEAPGYFIWDSAVFALRKMAKEGE